MFYIGDLSIQDVNLLCRLCRQANVIIEFGVGASTQVFAQAAPPNARIISVETDPNWIKRVSAILSIMKIGSQVEFLPYERWKLWDLDRPFIDMALDDGVDHLRMEFANLVWPLIKIGGSLIFHDTRRQHDFDTVVNFARTKYLEISTIEANADSSNLTIVTKKLAEPYVNWNGVENRPAVSAGYAPLEETLAYVGNRAGRK